jgi:hypothetical protein
LTAQENDKYKISDTAHVTVKILRNNGQIDFLIYEKYLQERAKNAYLNATLYFYDGVNVKEVKLMDIVPMPINPKDTTPMPIRVQSPYGYHIDNPNRETQTLIPVRSLQGYQIDSLISDSIMQKKH